MRRPSIPLRRRLGRRGGEPLPSGLAPGTLIADPDAASTTLRIVRYDAQRLDEVAGTLDDAKLRGLLDEGGEDSKLWIDIVGLADVAAFEQLGERFGLHSLLLEDAINVDQRPKVEHYDDGLFIIVRVAECDDELSLSSEQVGIVVRRGLVVTFRERPSPVFDPVRKRLEEQVGRLRERGADYLCYALLDLIVDTYLPLVDRYADALDALEDQVLRHPEVGDLLALHRIRRDLITLRRILVPTREAIHMIGRETEQVGFTTETMVFMRDCYDHAVRTLEQVDADRELASSVMELYLSTVSNRTNDVMKVLTMIATIFIPLSFIVGLYGMNFDPKASPWSMPELRQPYGYPVLLGVMALVVAGFVYFFKRKKWF